MTATIPVYVLVLSDVILLFISRHSVASWTSTRIYPCIKQYLCTH